MQKWFAYYFSKLLLSNKLIKLFNLEIYQLDLVNYMLYEWNIQLFKVDPDSQLYSDLQKFKQNEGKDQILLNLPH